MIMLLFRFFFRLDTLRPSPPHLVDAIVAEGRRTAEEVAIIERLPRLWCDDDCDDA